MGTLTHTGALAELEARAGASDQDRAAWLAERLTGLTATEIAGLASGKIKRDDLVALKLGRKVDTFSGNAYTEWGKLREPIIAEALRGLGIEPESRVFHHGENSRHLASPDGIGVDFDDQVVTSEIKTSGKVLLPVTSAAFKATGYGDQIQWALHVTGGVRCLLAVELRLNVDGAREGEPVFEPGQRETVWVDRDEARIAELIVIADDFFAELDRQREEGAPVIDEAVDTHALNYLRGLAAEKEGKALKETSYKALVAAGVSQESPLARVTYSPAKAGVVTSVPETDFEKAKRARGGKALFNALQATQDAVRDAQAAWDSHCERFTTIREVQGKGTAARVTVTAGKGTKA